MILSVELLVFIGASVIGPLPEAVTVTGSIPEPTMAEVQEYVVGAIDDVGRKLSAAEEHISTARSEELLVIIGFGETVTVTSMNEPTHPLTDGVIL